MQCTNTELNTQSRQRSEEAVASLASVVVTPLSTVHALWRYLLHVIAMVRDTHIMLFEVPIMLCSNSQNQANYAHCFVPIMLLIYNILHINL